jgi:uncharacterized membrane protein
MITDRMTARVLGLIVLVLALIIDVTCFLFARPETRESSRYVVVVAVTSAPLFLVGGLLLLKGSRMKDDRNDD